MPFELHKVGLLNISVLLKDDAYEDPDWRFNNDTDIWSFSIDADV